MDNACFEDDTPTGDTNSDGSSLDRSNREDPNQSDKPVDKPAGKDARGRFAKGNKLAKGGDPEAAKVLAFRHAIISAVSVADVKAIIHKAVDQAKSGDKAAREFVFDRLLGRPVTHVEASVAAANLKTFINVDLDKV